MAPFRYRDEPSLGNVLASFTIGAVAGFAVGVLVAQKVGGLAGLRAAAGRRFRRGETIEERAHLESEYDELEPEDELEESDDGGDIALEERVLAAFRRDPVLGQRAIDIGALGDGIIELSGWVDAEQELERATDAARAVDGVDTVVNRLMVGDVDEMDAEDFDQQEDALEDEGDATENTNAPLPGGRWEGNRVGTGRRRQGTSDEPDRHADPKVELEDKWLSEQHAEEMAAGDIEEVAERRRRARRGARGDRTHGGPIAPGGVPKGDHVADPEKAKDLLARDEGTGPRD